MDMRANEPTDVILFLFHKPEYKTLEKQNFLLQYYLTPLDTYRIRISFIHQVCDRTASLSCFLVFFNHFAVGTIMYILSLYMLRNWTNQFVFILRNLIN